MDAFFGGKSIHPFEDRVLSLEEVRRAQGNPDSFILVGKRDEQLRQMGNCVVWQVGAALGKKMGLAWLLSIAKGALNPPLSVSAVSLATSQNISQADHTLGMVPVELEKLSSITARPSTQVTTPGCASATTMTPASPGQQLPRELDSLISATGPIDSPEDTVDGFSVGGTTTVKQPDSNEPEIRGRDETQSSPSQAMKQQQKSSARSENSQIPLANRCNPQCESEEWSDRECLQVEPNGTIECEQRWHRTRPRPANSAGGNTGDNIVVVIPRRKRSTSVDEVSDSGSDSDIVYLETRPAKKKRAG